MIWKVTTSRYKNQTQHDIFSSTAVNNLLQIAVWNVFQTIF